jgi:hypothetical protein
MKAKQLTVVTGAGGSKPYGFPTGKELKTLTVEHLSVQGQIFNTVMRGSEHFHFARDDVNDFCNLLNDDELNESVDAFVSGHVNDPRIDEFTAIAKCATAAIIAQFEDPAELTDDDWYTVLLKQMFEGKNTLATFKENRVNFVTFNFDRSLEKYLIMKLRKQFNKSDSEIGEYLRDNFRFIHVHGSLGTLWEDSNGQSRRYETTFSSDQDLIEVAERIKFISDQMTSEEEQIVTIAKEVVASADIVDLFGVGYHAINMQRLGMGGGSEVIALPAHKFFGTVTGLSPIDISRISEKYSLNQLDDNSGRPHVAQYVHSAFNAKQVFDYIPTDW